MDTVKTVMNKTELLTSENGNSPVQINYGKALLTQNGGWKLIKVDFVIPKLFEGETNKASLQSTTRLLPK